MLELNKIYNMDNFMIDIKIMMGLFLLFCIFAVIRIEVVAKILLFCIIGYGLVFCMKQFKEINDIDNR